MDFSKFDEMVDIDGLKADIAEVNTNTGEYEEVPLGEYQVKVEKMELTESKKGDPMVTIWFKVVAGEHTGRLIFYNQLVRPNMPFAIHNVNELLNSMGVTTEISFDGYAAYEKLLQDVFKELEETNLTFHLDYSKNNKGYTVFVIKEVFKD